MSTGRQDLIAFGFALTEADRMIGQWGYDRPIVRGHGRTVDLFAVVFPEYAVWVIEHSDGLFSIVTVNDYSERLALNPGIPGTRVARAVINASDDAVADQR